MSDSNLVQISDFRARNQAKQSGRIEFSPEEYKCLLDLRNRLAVEGLYADCAIFNEGDRYTHFEFSPAYKSNKPKLCVCKIVCDEGFEFVVFQGAGEVARGGQLDVIVSYVKSFSGLLGVEEKAINNQGRQKLFLGPGCE